MGETRRHTMGGGKGDCKGKGGSKGKGGKGKGKGKGDSKGKGKGKGAGKGAGSKVVVEPHRHQGMFIAKGKEDALCTLNLVPGESVYGEKRISVDGEDGIDTCEFKPGAKVLYLG